MASKEDAATEEAGSTPLPSAFGASDKREPNSFFKSSIGNLSAEDLCTPTGVRFLIADIDNKQDQIDRLSPYVDLFHKTDKDVSVLKAAGTTSRWNEILAALCLAVGSAGLGAAPGLVLVKETALAGTVVGGLSTLLVVGSVIFRADIARRIFGSKT